jgi:hypothetical protein
MFPSSEGYKIEWRAAEVKRLGEKIRVLRGIANNGETSKIRLQAWDEAEKLDKRLDFVLHVVYGAFMDETSRKVVQS